LEMDGKLRKKVHVAGAKNKDWEELARDENYLYIGDIGNNRNKRENLRIYRVEIKEVLDLDTVSSERINIGYTEQKEFPPTSKADLNFDAEGMACYGGELWVFTKPNTDPWHGKTFVYRFPKTPGTYRREKHLELYIGDGGWWSDAITAADFHNNTLYISTYNRLITLNFAKGDFLEGQTVGYSSITQKEALLVLDNGMLLIGDEKHTLLGGGKLYLMKLPND